MGGLSDAQKRVYKTFWGGFRQRDFAHTNSGYPTAHYRLNHPNELVANKQPAKSPPALTSYSASEIAHQLRWWGKNPSEIERMKLKCIVSDQKCH